VTHQQWRSCGTWRDCAATSSRCTATNGELSTARRDPKGIGSVLQLSFLPGEYRPPTKGQFLGASCLNADHPLHPPVPPCNPCASALQHDAPQVGPPGPAQWPS
jgi:hypothetical protein